MESNPWLIWVAGLRRNAAEASGFSSAERRREGRGEWRLARWARRKPGFALWALAFAVTFGQLLLVEHPGHKWEWPKWMTPDEVEKWSLPTVPDTALLEEFSRAVNDALIVIGHGLIVDQVVVLPPYTRADACYIARENMICITQPYGDRELDQEVLVFDAAHECVHAIFTNAGLEQYAHLDPDQALRIEETTAYVLGAHIGGAVLSRRGEDGEAFTGRMLAWYRRQCDPKNVGSNHRAFRRMQDTMHIDGHDPYHVKSLEVHFWSLRMVDEIDAICRANPDPWDAAHEVARRYRLIDG